MHSSDKQLVEQARNGDRDALNEIFFRYQGRLTRMVQMRLDVRLQARIDASDVIQEAFFEATTRWEEYLAKPTMPLFLWLRFLVGQRLVTLHRHHRGTQMRDADREVSIYNQAMPEASSVAIAAQLVGDGTTPSQAFLRAERTLRLQEALNTISPSDREVLVLRHFEQLSLKETTQVLGISQAAAAQRYFRALKRLKGILRSLPGKRMTLENE